MEIAAHELQAKGYRLIEKMDHGQLTAFITPYLNKANAATVFYVAFNFVVLGAIVLLSAVTIATAKNAFCIIYLASGIVLAYGLIPLHEYIHALAYRANGAADISYDVNFRKFVFLTVADKFVAGRNEFLVIALAPFTVISTLLGIFIALSGHDWQLFAAGMLLMHTIFCIGDFGLVSFFLENRTKSVVTYDDKDLRQTFFYGFE